MLFWLIPLILIGLALVGIGVVIVRKIPALTVIDVSTIPEEKTRRVKERIILERFQRLQSERLGRVLKIVAAGGKALAGLGRRIVQRLYHLEQYYQKLKQGSVPGVHAVNPETIKRLLDDAENFLRQEEYVQAEKRYIEVISHNPKHVEAYEGLGNLYLKVRNFEQARETLAFALRLDSENASIQMSMAELELAVANPRSALEHLRKATTIRPKNPKYLDAYIETALTLKETEDATRGIGLLKEVNPENQKLPDFEKRLEEINSAPA
jgi:tetratricopeptide (TPR) repeat protein